LASLRQDPGVATFAITFVGTCRTYGNLDLERFAAELGLGDAFRLLDWLPQQEVRELMRGADLLLLPAQGWTLQIPNKLFDYLATRVPVLALVERGSETAGMLQAAGGHFLAFTDEPGTVLARTAAALAAAATGARATLSEAIAAWTTESQMRHLVGELEQRFALPPRPRHEASVPPTAHHTAR
jgi:hypothetical protein